MYTEEDLTYVVPIVQGWVKDGRTHDEILALARRMRADAELVKAALRHLEQSATDDGDSEIVRDGRTSKLNWYPGPQPNDAHWPALRSRLEQRLGADATAGIHKTTESILRALEAPGSTHFSTRGLVLGYVQSGKTTNFLSVASKAADRGYKLIVVLSGMTDILRNQTQGRVDELLVDENLDWHRLTTVDSDFSERNNAGSLFANFAKAEGGAMIAVIKKNPARLRRLRDWMLGAGVTAMKLAPMLLIDDEADQASIDVGSDVVSTINGLLRDILQHPKSAYVAYSATPFANLLIDPTNDEDLYPRDFIVPMAKPEGYFGAEQLFGSVADPTDDGLDVIRFIPDADIDVVRPPSRVALEEGWKAGQPASLRTAVQWFVLATAARRRRAGRAQHSSMLVHTSMLSDVHFDVAGSVGRQLDALRSALASGGERCEAIELELSKLWEAECAKQLAAEFGYDGIPWPEIREAIPGVLADSRVVVDNYKSTDRLVYEQGDPATVIVVGGNTLSRGLTLEGLVSSYFVRSASAYDTLLQMGRWFGYRAGYEDLGRVWMPERQALWFRDLAGVEAEVREQIGRYAKERVSPLELGVRIRLHPELAITAGIKMRHSREIALSYSSTRPQTTLLPLGAEELRSNRSAVEALLLELAKSSGTVEYPVGLSGRVSRVGYKSATPESILKLVESFAFSPEQISISSKLLARYIREEVEAGGLSEWRVVVMEGDGESVTLPGLRNVRTVIRSRVEGSAGNAANIRSLSSDRDRSIGLDHGVGNDLKAADIDALRQSQLPTEGILRIYPIDRESAPTRDQAESTSLPRVPLAADQTVYGLLFDFPRSMHPERAAGYAIANLPEREEELYETDLLNSVASDELAAEDQGTQD